MLQWQKRCLAGAIFSHQNTLQALSLDSDFRVSLVPLTTRNTKENRWHKASEGAQGCD